MPEYDWDCTDCKHEFIVECKIAERNDEQLCPKCGSKGVRCEVPRVAPIFQLKGGYWYRNGYDGINGLRKNDKRDKDKK
jgi:putative FmdB family regulatory protein